MAYYYVHNTGTGTAGYFASKQTSSFPAGAFTTVANAFAHTPAPSSGDYIMIAQSHFESSTASILITGAVNGVITYVSVDETNCDQYSVATAKQIECTSSSNDIIFGASDDENMACHGIWFETADDCRFAKDACLLYAKNCIFRVSASGDCCFSGSGKYSRACLVDCTYKADHNSALTFRFGTSIIEVNGGTATSTAAQGDLASMPSSTNTYGYIRNLDISGTDAGINLLDNFDANGVEVVQVEMYNLQLPASWTGNFVTTPAERAKRFIAVGCGEDGGAEYQYRYQEGECIAEEDSSIYRNGSTAWESNSSTKTSYKIETDDTVDRGLPFIVPLQPRYADLTNAASDTIVIEMASDDTLDNGEVWAVVWYPDDTNNEQRNSSTSAPADVLATVTTLTTSSETWGGTGVPTNKYKIEVTTSNGEKCAPEVYLCVGYDNSSGTGTGNPLYVCTTIDVS